MVVERTLYAVKCDKCGDLYYDKDLCTSLYHAADCAESLAELEGWGKTEDGKHICPECQKEVSARGEGCNVIKVKIYGKKDRRKI